MQKQDTWLVCAERRSQEGVWVGLAKTVFVKGRKVIRGGHLCVGLSRADQLIAPLMQTCSRSEVRLCVRALSSFRERIAGAIGEGYQRQHDRHLDQHADTVARAAPEDSPNRLIATATASSKKLDVPIMAQGAATLCGTFHAQAAA